MKKVIIIGLGLFLAGVAVIYGVNYAQLQAPMNDVLRTDPRNEGVDVSVHYGNYVIPSVLVYSMENLSGNKSRADVFRVFLQFADKIQDKRYDTVELAFRGNTRFVLQGDYFQKLGREYSLQNPVYTMRTLPENLRKPDGGKAYSPWSGGLLGVLNQQMEDFSDFHDQWYLNDFLAER